jgi:serine/threonine protein kinase/tetratricopeptide (TPR) repeat protein
MGRAINRFCAHPRNPRIRGHLSAARVLRVTSSLHAKLRAVDKTGDNTPWKRVRALYERLTRAASSRNSPPGSAGVSSRDSRDTPPVRIAHYAIVQKLGEGGMGVVYAARDERLARTVAVKTMSSLNDETARKRFWREAQLAASVNHPNVCQIYDVGEDGGELYIAMELLEGEALGERLRRGVLNVSETVRVGLGILAALSALHARGIVHRDLKPSNIFLTPHGVKVLDFGLARQEVEQSVAATALTRPGGVVGTPRYMAPEQVTGEAIDSRSDLFAAGAVLFEMLAGRPAFGGLNAFAALHATLYEQPPALTGSPAVAAVDRVIRRALAKRPAERPASADVMAEELRAIRDGDTDNTPAVARPLTRLVVLPFRVLRPDPETDFLAFSLSDAIATSLSSIGSLIVRSSAAAARFVAEAPDLRSLAADVDVDRVVMGTLLRAGDQLRAAAQLVEVPGGTLLTSHTVQSSLGDLFRLQDDISRRVVEALSLPLTGERPSPTPDAPKNPRAYEFYLRANELARTYDGLARARDLYEQCLELDPGFAPAWAHLGRCYRVIGKYIDATTNGEQQAEEAFRRALELNPRLSVTHKFYANLEADMGQARNALVRLLTQANRHGNDPELFAGLVHACRYCGLYEESIACHAEARRLDPNIPTSFTQTLLVAGEIERLLSFELPTIVAGADDGIRVIGLGLAGRRDEARRVLIAMAQRPRIPAFQTWTDHLLAWLDGRRADVLTGLAALSALKIQEDPEAIFQEGWLLCDVGEYEAGLGHLQRAVAKGYFAAPTLSHSRQFDALRRDPAFQALVEEAEAGRQQALAAFREAGGERLLGR